jgi:hypothetical protein
MVQSKIALIDTREAGQFKLYSLFGSGRDLTRYQIVGSVSLAEALAALIKINNINRLMVVDGLGRRFSALRTGVVMANALSYAAKLPLVNLTIPIDLEVEKDFAIIRPLIKKALRQKTGLQKPRYAFAPNITKKK